MPTYEGVSGGATLATALPSGLVVGDFILAVVSNETLASDLTVATGWTEFHEDVNVGAAGSLRYWACGIFFTGPTPATNWATTTGMVSYIAFSGVDASIEDITRTFTETSGTSVAPASQTTLTANVMKVALGAVFNWQAWSSSTMTNEAYDAGGAGPHGLYYEEEASAGSTGAEAFANVGSVLGVCMFYLKGGTPPPAQVTPWFQSAGAFSAEASTTALGPVAIPTDAVAGDILVIPLMLSSGGTFTGPGDGWAQFGTAVNNANHSSDWYWKRHDGSEADPTFTTSVTMSATIGGYARCYAFRNCIASGTPFEDVTMAGTAGTPTTTPQSAAIDTTGSNELAVCFALIDDDPAFSSGNPPALWELCATNVSSATGGDALFSAIWREMAAAGSVAAVTVGTLPGSDNWRTLTMALLPVVTVSAKAPPPFRQRLAHQRGIILR